MKAKIGILISALVILAAVYTGIWWHKSNELKDRVADALAELSQQENSTIELTYDKLERAGYPFKIELAFTNPKLIEKTNKAKIIHEGNVTVGQSIFNREKVWIKSSGKTEVTAPRKNEGDHHIIVSGNTFLECVNCGGHLHLVNNIIRSDLTFDEWIPLVLTDSSIKVSDFSIGQFGKDQSDYQEIAKIQNGFLQVKNKVEKGYNNFSVDLDVKKISSIASKKTIDDLTSIFPNVDREELKKAFFDLGTSEIVFQAHGSLPTLDNPFYKSPSLDTLPSFSFVVDKSDYKCDFYTHDGHGKLELDRLADKSDKLFKGLFYSEQEWKASEKLRPLLVKMVKIFGRKYETDKETDPIYQEIAKVLAEHSDELVPDYARFGLIQSLVDLKFNGKEAPNNGIEYFEWELKDYKLASDLYELNLDGKSEKKSDGTFISNVNIHLKNYKELFGDMLNYYTKWQTLLAQAKGKTQLPVISTKYVDRIEQFLESLSTQSKPDQLDIALDFPDENHIKIGTKTLHEAVEAWGQLVKDLDVEFKKSNPAPQPSQPK